MKRKWRFYLAFVGVCVSILAIEVAWFAGKWPLVSRIEVRNASSIQLAEVDVERGGRSAIFHDVSPGETRAMTAFVTGSEDFRIALTTTGAEQVWFCGYGGEAPWRVIGGFNILVTDSGGMAVAHKRTKGSYPKAFTPCGQGKRES